MLKIKLLIFDMDGLMFETGRLAYRAYFASAEKYDYEMNHQVYYYLTGRTEPAILKEMANIYGQDVPYLEWRKEMNHNKDKIFAKEQRVFKKKGLVNLLKYAKEHQLTTVVASSNHRENIVKYLEIEEVADFIDIVVSGDEVQQGKPDPEVFLTACKKAGVSPHEAVVLEDSRVGIKAANAGGMHSFLVEDDITDLPVKKGKYQLLTNLTDEMKYESEPDEVFADLDEVKEFLVRENN